MNPLLVIGYAGLVLAICWYFTGSRRDWRITLTLAVVLPALAFADWKAVQPPLGWPSRQPQPRQAGFLWGVIREPDPQASDRGRIFLWLDVGTDRPRAYSLPYTRQLHRQVQAAIDATKHGRTITVAHVATGHRPGHQGPAGGRLVFYQHPPVVLPAKEHP